MPSRPLLMCLALLLVWPGWQLPVIADLETPNPVGPLPGKFEMGRPLRAWLEGAEGEDVVSTAGLPPLPVDMRLPCQIPDRPCVQVTSCLVAVHGASLPTVDRHLADESTALKCQRCGAMCAAHNDMHS
jgi:hypothetical protein